MIEIALWRLNLLRAGYLLLIGGLGVIIWPSILDPASVWEPARGVVIAMLGALSVLALIGLRHPLLMLPILFWEIAWKTIWLTRIALPAWTDGSLDAAMTETAIECLMAILIAAVIPWDYVVRTYVQGPRNRWRRKAAR